MCQIFKISARENAKPTREKNEISARENWFPTREKNQKIPKKCPWKKSGREKGEKLAKKWAWKQIFAREKIEKKPKNAFHGHFFFHG